ncbi:MAG TPA: tetratricopeptide repeat protein [Bryobacteraceae bacterium]|nr:tetratricopeptide repeat protein [Bryobacteraceae bacterium]
MRGRLLGLAFAVLAGAPMIAAEMSGPQAEEALVLIDTARRCRAEKLNARSEALYRRAIAKIEAAAGPGTMDLIPALNGLAELYFDEQRYTESEALSLRSAALVEANLGDAHPLLATALQNLAAIYHVEEQYDKAGPLYLRALRIRERSLGPDHPFVAATLANLAALEGAQGNYGLAAEHYGRALKIQQAYFGEHDPQVAQTLAAYAAVLRKTCHKREAAAVEARRRAALRAASFDSADRGAPAAR